MGSIGEAGAAHFGSYQGMLEGFKIMKGVARADTVFHEKFSVNLQAIIISCIIIYLICK